LLTKRKNRKKINRKRGYGFEIKLTKNCYTKRLFWFNFNSFKRKIEKQLAIKYLKSSQNNGALPSVNPKYARI